MITPAEAEVLEALTKVWNLYVALPVQHPDDQREFRQSFHRCQEKVMIRPTVRDNPKLFVNEAPKQFVNKAKEADNG